MADVGVYPLTFLTAIFGPARRVTAHGQIVFPDRLTASGEPFTVGAPDFGVAWVELEDGTLVRLTTSFYVGQHSKQQGIEFHGDTGSVFISSWQDFDAEVELAPFGGSYEPVPCRVPSAASTGARRSPSSPAPSPSSVRIVRQGRTPPTSSRSSTRSRRRSATGVAVDVTSTFAAPPAPSR